MKNRIIILLIFFLVSGNTLLAQDENVKLAESLRMPVNLWDTYTFSESSAPYVKMITTISAPAFMCVYGFYEWGWDVTGESNFTLRPETYKGSYAVNGASDKWGHAYTNYAGKRLLTFMYRATGSSKNMANIQGALLMDVTSFIGELGDGFSPDYGFDPYDVLFNQFGILFGMLLDYSPFLDRIFTMHWEYFPSARIRHDMANYHKWDISTDYNDAKVLLTTKLVGIPYISLTPLRYLNFDLGYYTRGYRHSLEYPSRTRNIYIGLSINFTSVLGDMLPEGYTSSTLQSLFNYYHIPADYEAKTWVISDKPHSEFND